jgi:hypothetical protein
VTDEELKHQELFRRLERLTAAKMPPGYRFVAAADDVARFVLGKCTWAVLALTCHIELFSQAHRDLEARKTTGSTVLETQPS